jgi:glycosyltransferase involved in cell wall biosynthesis
MDAAVAPYPMLPTFYFSPLKIFEYMAAGLPVVASRIGQIPEVIRDGTHGLLCPPGDAAAVAAALCRLKEDPDLGARLGRAARAHVVQHYTWNQVASRILHLAGVASSPDRAVPAESLSS